MKHVLTSDLIGDRFSVGPCAVEYTRMKTQDHYWTDPPADELVQRHRISSGGYGSYPSGATSPANRRPGLNVSCF